MKPARILLRGIGRPQQAVLRGYTGRLGLRNGKGEQGMNVTELSGTALGGLGLSARLRGGGHAAWSVPARAGERGTRTDHMCRHGIPRPIVREGWKYLLSCFARNARRNSYGTMWCGRSSP